MKARPKLISSAPGPSRWSAAPRSACFGPIGITGFMTRPPGPARPDQHLLLGGRLQVHVGEVEAGELGEQGRVQLLVPLGATLLAALITRSHRTLGRRAEA